MGGNEEVRDERRDIIRRCFVNFSIPQMKSSTPNQYLLSTPDIMPCLLLRVDFFLVSPIYLDCFRSIFILSILIIITIDDDDDDNNNEGT